MPIKLDCPRCKNPLVVPTKLAGSYGTCPRCQGRFWVPDDAPQETFKDLGPERGAAPPPAGSVPLASPPSAPSLAVPPGVAPPPVSAPRQAPPPVSPGPPAAPANAAGAPLRSGTPVPAGPPVASGAAPGSVVRFGPDSVPAAPRGPQPPAPAPVAAIGVPPAAAPASPVQPGRKVARFITAEAAQSSLQPAADGKLPELKLGDAGDKPERESRSRGMNPLVIFGLLAVSVLASIMLVLMDSGPAAPTRTAERAEARRVLQTEYFADLDSPGPAKPYQLSLREALQAHSRGEFRRERQLYRRVLDLLRADPKPEKGITGSKARDTELEKQLIVLLSEP